LSNTGIGWFALPTSNRFLGMQEAWRNLMAILTDLALCWGNDNKTMWFET